MQSCLGFKPNEDHALTLVIAAVRVRNATEKGVQKVAHKGEQ